MRLWSIHPSYLDSKGLVALWRETLLAQNVLAGRTKGYKNHPQLDRFKAQDDPLSAIGAYLLHIQQEAESRGYNFDKDKIIRQDKKIRRIKVTQGQIEYEINWLSKKISKRSPKDLQRIKDAKQIACHPIFIVIDGGVETWERI